MKKRSSRESHALFQKLDHALHQDNYQPSNSLLFSLLLSLPINIYAKDRDGRFIYTSSSYCKNVGKTRLLASIEEPWQSPGVRRGYIQVIKSPIFSHINQYEVIGTVGRFRDITATGSKPKESLPKSAMHPGDVICKTDLDFYSPEEARKFLLDEQQVLRKEMPFYDREENFVTGGSNIWCLSSKYDLDNHDVAFIEKPFELKALLRAVRNLLDSQGEFIA